MNEKGRPAADWVVDTSRRDSGGVLLCQAPCQGLGSCPLGIRTERMDAEGIARFDFVCPANYDEGSGIAHGGWAASVMIEMVGHALILSGGFGYLGTFNIRYAKPVPVGVPLIGSAHVEGSERRKVFVSAGISTPSLDDLAAASAVLITAPT